MSKISEQKALEAYPKVPSPYYGDEQDRNLKYRFGFIQGYDQAMQYFFEKACKWLEMKIICYSKREYEELKEQFKNYMQDEN